MESNKSTKSEIESVAAILDAAPPFNPEQLRYPPSADVRAAEIVASTSSYVAENMIMKIARQLDGSATEPILVRWFPGNFFANWFGGKRT